MGQRLQRKFKQFGFTLIEVMVSLVILAVLSVLTAESMRSAIRTRAQISGDIARDSQLTDALRIIRNDISSAFHYRDIFITLQNAASVPPTPSPSPGQPAPPPPQSAPTPRPTAIPVTAFIGDAESLYFTTLSNVRTQKDSAESNEAKIGYFVKSCTTHSSDPHQPPSNGRCLVRSISPILDDDYTKPGTEAVLAENVENFKLRYLGPNHDDYVDSWKTDSNGETTTQDTFPYAVEVTLTIHNKNDPKDKPVTGTILAELRFPNNSPSPSPSPGAGATPAGRH